MFYEIDCYDEEFYKKLTILTSTFRFKHIFKYTTLLLSCNEWNFFLISTKYITLDLFTLPTCSQC